ncbi:MAG: hypothetical protein ACFFB4_15945 [Promethearchaeota archaeon]
MSFLEGLIGNFLFGWLNSYLYRKYLRKRNKDWIVFLAIIFISGLLFLDIFIYTGIVDIIWLNVIPWVNIPSIDSGRYFMWNSFLLFGIDLGIMPQSGLDLFAVFLFTSYIFWYYFGSKFGKFLHGYRPYQQGFYMVFRPVRKFIKEREKRMKGEAEAKSNK